MNNFTPGPWRAEKRGDVWQIAFGSDSAIGNLHPFNRHSEANARLIAAAPELYKALKAIKELLSQNEDIRVQSNSIPGEFKTDKVFRQVDSALAKVEAQ